MTKMSVKLLLVSLLIFIDVANAAEQWGNLKDKGIASGKPYSLDLTCERNEHLQSMRPKNGASYYIGTDGGPPICVVSNLTIRIESKQVRIPKKSFSDLANIRLDGVRVKANPTLMSFELSGGDGAATYVIRFIVSNGLLIRREIEELDDHEKKKLTIKNYSK